MKTKALGFLSISLCLAGLCGCSDSEEAVSAGAPVDPAVVKAYAEAGVNVNPSQQVRLNQELARVVLHGELDDVKKALAQGATTDAADHYGLKVLFMASKWGKTEVVKALLAAGANVSDTVATSHNRDGLGYGGTRAGTPMSYAAEAGHVEIMEILKAAGADVNQPDPEGNTPLMRAAEGGKLEAVKWLLQQGANPQAKSNTGATALSYCRMVINPDAQRQEIMRLLSSPPR